MSSSNRMRSLRSSFESAPRNCGQVKVVRSVSRNTIECDRYVPSLPLVLTFAQGVRLLYRSDRHE
jgi:hypothetical protein